MKKIYLFAVITVLGFCLRAQVIYTDIKDVTFTCNKKCGNNCYTYDCSKTYPLDLNNDGISDFIINTGSEVRKWDGGNGTYCCTNEFSNWVSIGALNDNSVLVNLGSAAAVMAGSDISSVSAWSTVVLGYFNLRSVYRDCGLSYSGLCGTIQNEGNWPNSTDRYLGLKMILNGNIHYGWARLSVFVDNSKALFKIKDYAYESTPERPINAGQIEPGVLRAKPAITSSSGEQSESTKLLVVPNPTSSSSTISFSLQRQEKVSLKIFDMNGRLISTIAEKDFAAGTHMLKWDAVNVGSGIYVLRMQARSYGETKKIIVAK